ncbi:Protein deglycase DJ-1 [Orchesella cincta]|uniref:Protein deglycase DJ-1 n=1 Tax=Orchesella cincta TaxID=48709 RepID=A0A1D2N866_ORCCI|nr:Protein deglycase DJ-1 [Orchesella cincta]
MAKTALVVITTGSEEIEAVEVTVAGLNSAGNTVMSRNVVFGAEKSLKDALASAPFDAIILPGGLKGAEAFVESEELGEVLRDQEKAGRLVAGICAAPTALYRRDLFLGKSLTSHPLVQERMTAGGKYQYKEDRVVIDGNLITSRGPGTALEWSLAITAFLLGQEKADELSKAMLAK